MNLLRRVASEFQTAVLMATHSLEAAALTDTIVQLRDGRVEEIRHLRGEHEQAGVRRV
jgi:ABC-type lipoprotein export system ATPase subunit